MDNQELFETIADINTNGLDWPLFHKSINDVLLVSRSRFGDQGIVAIAGHPAAIECLVRQYNALSDQREFSLKHDLAEGIRIDGQNYNFEYTLNEIPLLSDDGFNLPQMWIGSLPHAAGSYHPSEGAKLFTPPDEDWGSLKFRSIH